MTTTTIWLDRDGISRPFEVSGSFCPEQKEIRYPNDRAQPGIPAYFDNIEIIGDDGEIADDEHSIQIAEEALFAEYARGWD